MAYGNTYRGMTPAEYAAHLQAQQGSAGGNFANSQTAKDLASAVGSWAAKKAAVDAAAGTTAATTTGATAGAGATGAGAGTTAGAVGAAALPVAAAIAAGLMANEGYNAARYKDPDEATKDWETYKFGGWSAVPAWYNSSRNEKTSDTLKDEKVLLSLTNPLTAAYGVTRLLGSAFNRPLTQVEQQQWGKLAKNNLVAKQNIPDWVVMGEDPKGDQTRKDLPLDFVGFDDKGQWVNNKFAQSRDEKDLTANDIAGYADFNREDNFGKDWLEKYTEQQRLGIADLALKNKGFRESYGTGDVNRKDLDQEALNAIINDSNYKFSGLMPTDTQRAEAQKVKAQKRTDYMNKKGIFDPSMIGQIPSLEQRLGYKPSSDYEKRYNEILAKSLGSQQSSDKWVKL